MDNTQDNIGYRKERIDLKAWMKEHSQEYGEMAFGMGEADLFELFMMGQTACMASPEFQKRLEEMVDLDSVDVDELVGILNESGFAEVALTNPCQDEDWEKYRLPFAAWLKHGRLPEMLIENLEDAISLTDNQQGKWQLAMFLKDLMIKR